MFFLRMIFRSFSRQFKRRMMIAVTVCLSATVSVAMLGVVFDVGDKLNEELSAYGSNITIQPKSDAVIDDLYETEDGDSTDPTSFLAESDIPKIKTIFWAYNITNFAPELNMHVSVAVGDVTSEIVSESTDGTTGDTSDGTDDVTDDAADNSADGSDSAVYDATSVSAVGTWFSKTLELETGETTVVGVDGMRSWWTVTGEWVTDDSDEIMIGAELAEELGIDSTGGTITLGYGDSAMVFTVVGIYDSGDDENSSVYLASSKLQELTGLIDCVDVVEVKALTTPENDLAEKASKNPAALTSEEWETWYCTAYASSIAYQIEEVLPDATAKQVRQVSELQGDVLNKTRAVMIVMTVLSLIAAAVAVANLMAASISERSSELALLKAIGATDGAVARLMLMETAVISLAGALVGSLLGVGAAELIGQVVFSSSITMRPMVFVLVFVLLAVTVLIASFSSIRSILGVRPAEVLHGR